MTDVASARAEWRQHFMLPIAAGLGYATSVIHVYGFGSFLGPISAEFGWSRFQTTAGLTIALGSIGPALGEGRAVATALSSLAQQPDAAATITRTLFVGLAMIESIAIYCFVVSMILIFANPFWDHLVAHGPK